MTAALGAKRGATLVDSELLVGRRQVRKSAAALLVEPRVGLRFDAIVTAASAKGVWVRLLALPVEGRVVRGEQRLDVGERTVVRLVATDVARGFIDAVRVS